MAARILSLLLAVAVIPFLPKSILIGGLIWLLGAGVFFLIQKDRIRGIVIHPLWLSIGLLVTVGSLLESRSGQIGIGGEGGDLIIGIGCAALIPGLATRTSTSYYYGVFSAGASEIFYTLYLVHFPVLAFLFFGIFRGSQIFPSSTTAAWFAGVHALTIFYSAVIWWLFERNTDRHCCLVSRSCLSGYN